MVRSPWRETSADSLPGESSGDGSKEPAETLIAPASSARRDPIPASDTASGAYPIAVRFVFFGSSKGSVWAVAEPETTAPRTSKGVP